MLVRVLSVLFVLQWFTVVYANDLTETVGQATSAYDSGDFQLAADLMLEARQLGATGGALLYNLGNAWFRLDEKGKAMAAYLQARKVLPRDPDIRANLRLLQKQTRDELEPTLRRGLGYRMLFWLDVLSLKEQLVFASWLWALGCVFAGFVIWRRWSGLWLTPAAFSAALAALLLVGAYVSSVYKADWGAIQTKSAKVFSGPNKLSNPVVFELSEASPVAIQRERDGWYLIELSDGHKGWIETEHVAYYR